MFGIFQQAVGGRRRDRIIVSGAGSSSANGKYKNKKTEDFPTGKSNGKPVYILETDDAVFVTFNGSIWILGSGFVAVYQNASDKVDSKDWTVTGGDIGTLPAPTVRFG